MNHKKGKISKAKDFLLGKGCSQYNIRLWECPSFLFVIMGTITIVGMVVTFYIGQRIATPDAVIPAIFFIALAIFVPGSIIVQSFDRMATANRMKSEFINIVSHQLRSPLAAIKWTVNTLDSQDLSEKDRKQYIQLIKENSQHMVKMVNDLLNVSRIERGDLRLNSEMIDMDELVQETIEDLEPVAAAKNIKVKLKIDTPKGCMVKGDEVYIGMAVTNFLDNAIRYSESGSEIAIKLVNADSSVHYEVEDHGRGIPEDEKEFIFQKFFRARNTSHKPEGGTGLGLFIAKASIEQMHGKAGFSSKESEGSKFWFELPLAAKEENSEKSHN